MFFTAWMVVRVNGRNQESKNIWNGGIDTQLAIDKLQNVR